MREAGDIRRDVMEASAKALCVAIGEDPEATTTLCGYPRERWRDRWFDATRMLNALAKDHAPLVREFLDLVAHEAAEHVDA